MSRLGPLHAALAIFPLLALAAALPYVALQYRRRGTVGAGHLLLAGAAGLYLIGLAFYVILPLRAVTPDFCAHFGVDPQWNPFHYLAEARLERAIGGWRALLGDYYVQQVILNVVLFVPLGLFVRHLLRRGVAATVAIGFGVSLFIELTQLSGDWGIYPCAYRFFETADLISNTAGAAIGALIAPVLRAVPAQLDAVDPGAPAPVTPLRRLLAGLCDAAALIAFGLVLLALAGAVLEVTRGQLFDSTSLRARVLRGSTVVAAPGALLMLAVPLAWQGRTAGQWAAQLRPVDADGVGLERAAVVRRFLIGPAIPLALAGIGMLGVERAWAAAAGAIALQVMAVAGARREGPAVKAAGGVRIVDARSSVRPTPRAGAGGGPSVS